MSTAARSRSQVVMMTPSPAKRTKQKKGPKISAQEKQALLDNFDLEVTDRTMVFHQALATALTNFQFRQTSELLRIPRDLKEMTLAQLDQHWGGSWTGTVRRMQYEREREKERARVEEEERKKREAEEREREREELSKGKRKRNNTNSPERSSKTARMGSTPLKNATPLRGKALPGSASKRRIGQKGKLPALDGTKSPSGLPQNHIFNPSLNTPLRQLNAGDIILSRNGSPIANPLSAQKPAGQFRLPAVAQAHSPLATGRPTGHLIESDSEAPSGDETDDGNDLPDVDEMMRQAEKVQLAKSTSASQRSQHHSQREGFKSRRKSSITVGFDLAYAARKQNENSGGGGDARTITSSGSQSAAKPPPPVQEGFKRFYVNAKGGNVNYFDCDPLNVERSEIDEWLREWRADEDECASLKAQLEKTVMEALRSRMEDWRRG